MQRAVSVLVVAATIFVAPPAVDSQTLTQSPRAYRIYLRRQVDKKLAELHRVASELVERLDGGTSSSGRSELELAGKVLELSRDVWTDVQERKPTRKRQKLEPAAPRNRLASRADAVEARDLVREIARLVSAEWRSARIDVTRRLEILDKLERVERIGHRLRADFRSGPPAIHKDEPDDPGRARESLAFALRPVDLGRVAVLGLLAL
jgi:hypothetical protein